MLNSLTDNLARASSCAENGIIDRIDSVIVWIARKIYKRWLQAEMLKLLLRRSSKFLA